MICNLEVCANSVMSAIAAQEGGAQRVELCSVLGVGGVTPSYGAIRSAREALHIELNVLLRPREGNFVYNEVEIREVEADIRACAELGVNGVVIGALDFMGNVDRAAMERWIRIAKDAGLSVTFHRAIDVSRDVFQTLEEAIDLGCDCVLTSGGYATAPEGVDVLQEMVRVANGRIVIMPGSGVNPENAAAIIRQTQASFIHSSARKNRPAEDGWTGWSDASVVREIRNQLDLL
ncbi:MAG: copper homeostasis protein CutC [Bacteroidales bacterium]|nr:copper homeostasis protein CutC [Bacteroidales bacterium]